MRTNRCVIDIGYIYVDKETSQEVIREEQVRATSLNVYQSRLNEALIQGVKVNGRYRVRDVYDHDTINYIKTDGKKYRVNSVYRNQTSHYIEIEVGEMYRG